MTGLCESSWMPYNLLTLVLPGGFPKATLFPRTEMLHWEVPSLCIKTRVHLMVLHITFGWF